MYVPQQLAQLTCSAPSVRRDAAPHVLTRDPGSPPQLPRVRKERREAQLTSVTTFELAKEVLENMP